MFFWSLLLVSSFPFSTHSNVDLMARGYDDEAIIQTFLIEGEVYDCIDIYKQPSMKHPLLINHKIQMEPTSYPEMTQHPEKNGADGESPIGVAKPWSLPESCPEGSVPMRRVQGMMGGHNSSDVNLHARRRQRNFLGRNGTNIYNNEENYDETLHEDAAIKISGERYLAAKAYITVSAPWIEMEEEASVSQIWIHSMDVMISLKAGLAAIPLLNGDSKSRFFTMWTTNHYETYCFNNQCPGYVHTNPNIAPDTYFTPISVVGGPEYSVNVEIFQDTTTKDWWVNLQGNLMGYWPRDLVPSFESGAEVVLFGGKVVNMRTNGRHTTTNMGMGTFPSEGHGRAAFFKNVEVLPVGSPNGEYQPPTENPVIFCQLPNCYNISLGSPLTEDWGYHFFFGGPGWSAICP